MQEEDSKSGETVIEKEKIPEVPKAAQSAAHQIDWVLQSLVAMANGEAGLEIPITLSNGGFLVSGTLFSAAKYLDAFAEQIASGFSAENAEIGEALRRAFQEAKEKLYSVPESDRSPAGYIHLRDARYFHVNGKPIPARGGVIWRGKLSEISAFTFGTLEYSEN